MSSGTTPSGAIAISLNTSRATIGGNQSLGSPAHYSTRADLDSFPARSPLERSNALQTILDIAAVLFAFLFVSVTGIGFAFAIAVALFVRIP